MISLLTALATYTLITNALTLPHNDSGLDSMLDLLKRKDNPPIIFAIWDQPNCPGEANDIKELQTITTIEVSQNIMSYKVGRNLTEKDGLFFLEAQGLFHPDNGPPCYRTKYIGKINPMNTPQYDSSLLLKDHCYDFTASNVARVSLLACPTLWAKANVYSVSNSAISGGRPKAFRSLVFWQPGLLYFVAIKRKYQVGGSRRWTCLHSDMGGRAKEIFLLKDVAFGAIARMEISYSNWTMRAVYS